jgi:hypothetical protein
LGGRGRMHLGDGGQPGAGAAEQARRGGLALWQRLCAAVAGRALRRAALPGAGLPAGGRRRASAGGVLPHGGPFEPGCRPTALRHDQRVLADGG